MTSAQRAPENDSTSPDEQSRPTRYRAVFTPQAWINDYAVTVDAQGETEFDVTAEIQERLAAGKEIPDSDTWESDDLISAKTAPEWIRNWSGPFYITVEEC